MMFTRAGDPTIETVRAWRWQLASAAERAGLARRLSEAGSTLQLFDDVEAPALLGSAWGAAPPSPLDRPGIPVPTWSAEAERVASWRAARDGRAECLVVVRQPLKRPDPAGQRDWVTTVLRALDGDASPPDGLLSANFFATRDGAVVYNFAEWASAEAHRKALQRGSYGQHGSLGSSQLWRAAREHPAITPEHEVRRYALHRASAHT